MQFFVVIQKYLSVVNLDSVNKKWLLFLPYCNDLLLTSCRGTGKAPELSRIARFFASLSGMFSMTPLEPIWALTVGSEIS